MRFSLKFRYASYMVILHLVLMLLVYRLLWEDKLLFIASEIFLLLSVAGSVRLYQYFMEPNEYVRSGIEAIKDRDFTIKFVPTGKKEVDALIEVYNLMIDQLREERTRLNEQHFFLQKLIAASPIAIIVLDFDERIETFNEKAEALADLDLHSIQGKLLDETNIPFLNELADLADGTSKVIKRDGVQTFKIQRSHFMTQGFRRSFVMIEELTAEILESEKKAYGKVIRMMAHEVNNTLGATDSILQSARGLLTDEAFSDLVEAFRVASDRNKRLTRFMRNFADVVRLPPPALSETRFDEFLHDVTLFMQAFADKQKVILEIIEIKEVKLFVDRGQMEQVLVNVIKNGIEACEAGHRVHVELSGSQLVIKNNGKPISQEQSEQLFNPFFSSKPQGQGIGLTLSREILVNHGFSFSLKTTESGWTEFVVVFEK